MYIEEGTGMSDETMSDYLEGKIKVDDHGFEVKDKEIIGLPEGVKYIYQSQNGAYGRDKKGKIFIIYGRAKVKHPQFLSRYLHVKAQNLGHDFFPVIDDTVSIEIGAENPKKLASQLKKTDNIIAEFKRTVDDILDPNAGC